MISFNHPGRGDSQTSNQPIFEPGQLVRHRRYGYRGVVVNADSVCCADDKWYQKNQTQPDRDQAWYHILVHQSSQSTYAAEENLMPDFSESEIQHPLVPYFFSGFEDGIYIRNDQPWPA